jgi:hypothetical protein
MMSRFRIGVAIAATAAALVGVGPSVAYAASPSQEMRLTSAPAPRVAAAADTQRDIRSITPDTYPPLPSECQFSAVIFRESNNVVGDGPVTCEKDATSIGITLTIQRSRFYGWQTMKSEELEVHNTDQFLMFLQYNCAGTGTHDFRLIATAWMLDGGTLYQSPDVYKKISNVTC